MKKKLAFFLLTAISALVSACCLSACNSDKVETDGYGLKYKLSEDKDYYILFGHDDKFDESEIAVPDEFGGLPVKAIGRYAFEGCRSLTGITIHDGVTVIENSAFAECDCLTIKCEIADEPESWNTNWNYYNHPVVWNCKNNEIADDGYIYTVSDGIRFALKDGEAVVAKQPKNITDAIIPQTVTHNGINYTVTAIGEKAFFDNYNKLFVSLISYGNLKSVVIPESVTSIGKNAFDNCGKLKSITVSKNIENIGEKAFNLCENLSEINFTGSLADWCNASVFYGLKNENKSGYTLYIDGEKISGKLIIPENVTDICDYAFYRCREITDLTISDGVKSIGEYAFGNCYTITSVALPYSITSIGRSAFEINDFLSIAIPENITSIDSFTFYGCAKLENIIIPENVTSIGNFAFGNCRLLKSVTIPSGVTSIGSWAFEDCENLKEINFNGTKGQWTAIELQENWNLRTGSYTVNCTDGKIEK